MPTQQEPWFVIDRSEALAGLLLTSRADVRVRTERKTDDGVDLLVEIDPGTRLSTKLFMVQVKGTATRDMNPWLACLDPFEQTTGQATVLPVCLFAADVRGNRLFYAWVAEPVIEENRAELRSLPSHLFRELDDRALDEIVQQVKAWYAAVPGRLPAQKR